MKNTFILLIVALFSFTAIQAQAPEDLNNKQALEVADELYMQGSYYNAIKYYGKIYTDDDKNASYAAFMLAESNYRLRDYKNAVKWYKKSLKSTGENSEMIRFNYGRALKSTGNYETAKEQFTLFSTEYAGQNATEYKALAKTEIEGCVWAMNNTDLKDIEVNHLGKNINAPYTEFAPIYMDDNQLVYSSLRTSKVLEADQTEVYSRIYSAEKDGEEWGKGEAITAPINAGEVHTGNVAYSKEDGGIYFTQCMTNESLKMICNVYFSKKMGNTYGEPKKLDINMDGYTTTQPAVANAGNGKTLLYFVSNRPGGQGGLDIWYAVGNAASFGEAMNAKGLNTFGDEISPSYSAVDNEFFFSSNGHVNIGGFDVFTAQGSRGEWTNITNFGAPVNTMTDDMYFSLDGSGEKGFLVSNRPGTISLKSETCCDDIFEMNLLYKLKFASKGVVLDGNTKTALKGATVTLYRTDDGEKMIDKVALKDINNWNFPLVRNANYKVVAERDGYISSNTTFSTMDMTSSKTLEGEIMLEKEPAPAATIVILENIYYDFDKSNLREDARATIESNIQILKDNPQLFVEIGSHTDSKGSDEYNKALSERRSKSAMDYLMSQGISADRLRDIYYGETQSVAPNENPDGSDNPDGRQLNRRTEFKVLDPIK